MFLLFVCLKCNVKHNKFFQALLCISLVLAFASTGLCGFLSFHTTDAYCKRSVFLDHSLGEEAVKQSLEKLTQLSLSTGRAIGIGHPHASTIKSLKEMIPKIQEKGIDIVPLSSMMD